MHKDEDDKTEQIPLSSDPDSLLRRYGDHLTRQNLTEDQQKTMLAALWNIMVAFADLGFSVKPGDKFVPKCDLGFDDVLQSLIIEETAHETVAPDHPNKTKEQP